MEVAPDCRSTLVDSHRYPRSRQQVARTRLWAPNWHKSRLATYPAMWINFRVPDKSPAVSIARSGTNPNSLAMLISGVDPGLLPYSGHGRRCRLGSPPRVVL
jgi:hypothetical protein